MPSSWSSACSGRPIKFSLRRGVPTRISPKLGRRSGVSELAGLALAAAAIDLASTAPSPLQSAASQAVAMIDAATLLAMCSMSDAASERPSVDEMHIKHSSCASSSGSTSIRSALMAQAAKRVWMAPTRALTSHRGDDRVANSANFYRPLHEPSREDFNDRNLNPGQDTREILMT